MIASPVQRLCAALSLIAVLLLLAGPAQARAADPAPISAALDNDLASVGTYWDQTLAAEGRPAPSVQHVWVAPGAQVGTSCGAPADDTAAFYCPTDDTIYIGQAFARALYDGVANGLPGQSAGFGHAAGQFAVAYVVAHEYGHNIQQESGVLAGRVRALPTELNADCLAGTWGHWAYGQGKMDDAGVKQVLDAALAVGDFDFLSPQHHGTPQQRRDALLTGFRSGSPPACDPYLQMQ
jgi:predicted metalloprotease